MGMSSKGFIATDNKDVFLVANRISNVLKNYKNNKPNNKFMEGLPSSASADFELSPHHGLFTVLFMDGDDKRLLFVNFDCDHDAESTYIGKKIIFSLGWWGRSDEIILDMLRACEDLGDIYINPNDDEYFTKVTPEYCL